MSTWCERSIKTSTAAARDPANQAGPPRTFAILEPASCLVKRFRRGIERHREHRSHRFQARRRRRGVRPGNRKRRPPAWSRSGSARGSRRSRDRRPRHATPAATSSATAVMAMDSFKSTTARIPLPRLQPRWIRRETRTMPRACSRACSSATAGTSSEALSAYNTGSPTAAGTKTRWSDGSDLAYADSVMRHYQRLTGESPHSSAIAESRNGHRFGRCRCILLRNAPPRCRLLRSSDGCRPAARYSRVSPASNGLSRTPGRRHRREQLVEKEQPHVIFALR